MTRRPPIPMLFDIHRSSRHFLLEFSRQNFSASAYSPTRLTKNQCISFLQKCKSMRHLKQVHCQILMSGLGHHKDIADDLLVFSTDPESGDLSYAKTLFGCLRARSLFVYNLMIKSFTKSGRSRMAIELFDEMTKDGLSPDNFTYPLVLKAIGDLKVAAEGRGVHGFIVKSGYEFDAYVRTSLMDMYAEMGRVDVARELFDETPDRDVICWNVLIATYIKCKKFENAVSAFWKMEQVGVVPNEATLVTVLSACVAVGDREIGEGVHHYVEKKFISSVPVSNALLDMYSKCGALDMARRLFDDMPSKNVVSWTNMVSGYVNSARLDEAREVFDQSPARDVILWTAMINGYAKYNRFEEALALFREMQERRIIPDKFTVVAVLAVCANLGALDQGRWIHGFIGNNKVEIDAVVGTALMDMYSKCGCVEESLKIFARINNKDNATWTSIIFGLAINGETSKALGLFSEMQRVGLKPDDITFIGVLTACSHGGLVEEGRQCFHNMKVVYQIEPKREHYGCLVDLLGRAGLIDEAEKLIESIPIKDTEDMLPFWVALLGACRIHGNLKKVERIAKQVTQLEAGNSGVHTLVANAYAGADKWENATKVRRKMKDLGIRKTPGCSSIEVNGAIYEFLAGDTSHSETREIYTVLHSLSRVSRSGKRK